ncbi:MAG: hypothetical protein HQL64_16885 [Magnetococcales bacterium]|nr:hypothetical protein [Magnetococcales bacterium]
MKSSKCLLLAIVLGISLPFRLASAAEFNQRSHADPGSDAKINRAMPQSRMNTNGGNLEAAPGQNVKRSCNSSVGAVKVEKGARAPREVTTVVRGDVINVCR